MRLNDNYVALPQGAKPVSISRSGVSEHCKTFKIELEVPDGQTQAFFLKVRVLHLSLGAIELILYRDERRAMAS